MNEPRDISNDEFRKECIEYLDRLKSLKEQNEEHQERLRDIPDDLRDGEYEELREEVIEATAEINVLIHEIELAISLTGGDGER